MVFRINTHTSTPRLLKWWHRRQRWFPVCIEAETAISDSINNKILKLDSCLVIPSTPNRGKPRAIIKFLGGAFIGAVPEVTYGYLIEYLAKEGFLLVLVPYNVTFDHAQATKQVHERFQACLDTILTSGFPEANLSHAQLGDLLLFSVGHSNGSLLQLFNGSYFSEKIPKETKREVLTSLTKFVDQLPSVRNEVTQGLSEFKPSPSENRDRFKCSYNVEHTLLVKFSSDTIDETYT